MAVSPGRPVLNDRPKASGKPSGLGWQVIAVLFCTWQPGAAGAQHSFALNSISADVLPGCVAAENLPRDSGLLVRLGATASETLVTNAVVDCWGPAFMSGIPCAEECFGLCQNCGCTAHLRYV